MMATGEFDRIEHARIEGNLILNPTPSMQPGAYIRMPVLPSLGAVVCVRMIDLIGEAAAQVFFDRPFDASAIAKAASVPLSELRLLKRIAATAGDEVEIEQHSVVVNGALLARRASRAEQVDVCCSEALPFWSGRKILDADEVLLLCDANDPLSLDGRFAGPSRLEIIESVLSLLSESECEELARRVNQSGWIVGYPTKVQ